MKVVTISLRLLNGQLRVFTKAEGSRYDQGIDLSDGYPDAADAVLKEVLRAVSKIDWESALKKLVDSTH